MALKDTMKNKLVRMRKEEVAAKFEVLSRHLFGGLRKTTTASGRIRCVLLEIRTGRFHSNMNFSFEMKLIMTAWPWREMVSRYSYSSELNQHYSSDVT
jgi:hypothetical protein